MNPPKHFSHLALLTLAIITLLWPQHASSQTQYVDVTTYGAMGDGITDDTAAIQAAINSITEGTVYFPAGDYKITNGIAIGKHNLHLIGDATATLKMYTQPLNGGALVCVRTGNGQGAYPINISIKNINVDVDAAVNAAGIVWKASYSEMHNVNVRIRGNNKKGVVIHGDAALGSGSYYNLFSRVYVQGDANSTNGYSVVGLDLTYDSAMPSRCPNANTFTSCRTGGTSTAVRLRGNANTFTGCIHEATTQYVYDVLHEVTSSGSSRNLVMNPYVEHYTAVIFNCQANASGNTLISPYYTAVSQVFVDNSTLQNNIFIDPTTY